MSMGSCARTSALCPLGLWPDSLYLLPKSFNPSNAELNPICHLLALLGAHHIFHVGGLRVKVSLFLAIILSSYLALRSLIKPWLAGCHGAEKIDLCGVRASLSRPNPKIEDHVMFLCQAGSFKLLWYRWYTHTHTHKHKHTQTHTHTHTHTHIYIYIYILCVLWNNFKTAS
jgi:hypothetical protein